MAKVFPGGKIARDDASVDGFSVAEGLSCHGNNIKMIKVDFVRAFMMYFILSKPDDCFLLGYGPGLDLNHIHKLSLLVILFFIASTVLFLA